MAGWPCDKPARTVAGGSSASHSIHWTKQLTPELWFGGSPVRVARLTRLVRRLLATVADGSSCFARLPVELARYLTDTGLAHPVPPEPSTRPDVTVIVPARDRTGLLERCLAALGGEYQVIVVDDASADPEAVGWSPAATGPS